MILLHIYKSEYKFREFFFLYISKSDYSRYLTIHIHLQMCDYSTSFIDFFYFLFFGPSWMISPLFPMLGLFQDCSSDGPGQPSMQATLETKNSFKTKEAQDQGSTLCSQARLSEVDQRHSCMSQSSRIAHLRTVFTGS